MTTPAQPTVALPTMADLIADAGRKVPVVKFRNVNDAVSGRICEEPIVGQEKEFGTDNLAFWSDGSPKIQGVFTLQTEIRSPEIPGDDGRRRIYAAGALLRAILKAAHAAGAADFEIGGSLSVVHSGHGAPKAGFAAPKLFEADYQLPAQQAPQAVVPQQAAPQVVPAAPPVVPLGNPADIPF